MPAFAIGHYRIEFDVQPLAGQAAAAEREMAWRLCLQLTCRAGLREDKLAKEEIRALIDDLRGLLVLWPVAQLPEAEPRQLGVVVLEVIEVVLMPCLGLEHMPEAVVKAVQAFCGDWAAELAQLYRLPACQVETQVDLRTAWELE